MAGLNYLHRAILASDFENVKFLIQVGANVNIPVHDSSKRTPLVLAVERGLAQIVHALLSAGRLFHVCSIPSVHLFLFFFFPIFGQLMSIRPPFVFFMYIYFRGYS